MKKLQSLLSFLTIGIFILVSSCKPSQPKGSIELPKAEFAPDEAIKIQYTAEGTFGKGAWIGIIPSATPHGDEATNDGYDISYQYFEGTSSGEMTFTAPAIPGNYDFRMHNTDENGIEVASVTFAVVAPLLEVSLTTNKNEFEVGEEIEVNFTAPYTFSENAWIGLIPSETPHGNEADNDAADVAYGYLKKQSQGALFFKAPDKKGSWDIRMNDSDNNGKEVASITITIK